MKALTMFLFVSITFGPGIGDAAQGVSLEIPAENLHIRGTNTWVSMRGLHVEPSFDGSLSLQQPTQGDRLGRFFDGNLNLQRATRRGVIYRGNVTIVEEVGNETRKVETWMELRLRQRRGEWTGRVHSGFFGGSRLTAAVHLAEGSGTALFVLRGPVRVVDCGSGDHECSKYLNGEVELTLTETE